MTQDRHVPSISFSTIYKKVALFVYSQPLVSIEQVEQNCQLLSFEAHEYLNCLVATGVIRAEGQFHYSVFRGKGGVGEFEEMILDGLLECDPCIRVAARTAAIDDLQLARFHRTAIVKEMLCKFPSFVMSAAHVDICEMMFRGERKADILLACDKSGLNEVEVWLRAVLEPLAPLSRVTFPMGEKP